MYLFFILAYFLPSYTPLPPPPNSTKNQDLKKMKKTLEILSFYTSVPKIMIRSGIVPEIWCATDGWTEGHTDFWTDGWSGGQKK